MAALLRHICTPHHHHRLFSRFLCISPSPSSPSLSLIDDIARVLSDHRLPHHDLESALLPFAASLASSPSLLDHLLRRCLHLPLPCHRLFLFSSSLRPPSPLSHRILLSLLLRHRLFPLFWSHLSDHSFLPDPPTFRLLFRSYARSHLPHDAVRAFLRMPQFSLPPSPDDLSSLLLSLCRHRSFPHALRFFRRISPQFPPDPKPYSILIHHSPTSPLALSLFHHLLRRTSPSSLDTPLFTALVSALCRARDFDSAYRTLGEMKSVYSLDPDASTYSAFVRAHCDAKDAHAALRALDSMRRKSLSPNVYTYNCVIRLLCERREVDEAYGILDEMIRGGAKPDAWSYNAIMAVHCGLREANRALRLMKKMDGDGCLPDRRTYNMVMKMLIGVGRIDRAMEVWDGMEGRGFYPAASSYAVMIHGLCRKKGRAADASRYFEAMVEEGVPPYLATCELLRGELLRLGLRERVEVLADRMRRSTSCTIRELASAMEGKKRSENADRGQQDRLPDAGEGVLPVDVDVDFELRHDDPWAMQEEEEEGFPN